MKFLKEKKKLLTGYLVAVFVFGITNISLAADNPLEQPVQKLLGMFEGPLQTGAGIGFVVGAIKFLFAKQADNPRGQTQGIQIMVVAAVIFIAAGQLTSLLF